MASISISGTSSHIRSSADQFGFGKPIVEEYKRRYGVDILRQQFDLEKWRRLCGEYLTQFIRELGKMVAARKKEFLVGIPQGDYLGLPNSNMHVDWRTWVRDRLVDGLVVGVVTGKFIFPERVGYGYLTDMEDGIGLPQYALGSTEQILAAVRATRREAICPAGPRNQNPLASVPENTDRWSLHTGNLFSRPLERAPLSAPGLGVGAGR